MPVLLLLAACDFGDPPGTAPTALSCQTRVETSLAGDEVIPSGLSPDAVATRVHATSASITWAAHPISTVDLAPTVDLTTARFVDRELPDTDEEGPQPILTCTDGIAIDGRVELATTDGLLAETWPVTFYADTSTVTTAAGVFDPDEVAGAWTLTEVELGEGAATLLLDVAWTATADSGRLVGEVDDGRFFDVASW